MRRSKMENSTASGCEPIWLGKYRSRASVSSRSMALPWPRPRSRVLDDRQYVYQASSDVNGGTVTIGYPSFALGVVCRAAFQLVAAGGCAPGAQYPNRSGSRSRANQCPGTSAGRLSGSVGHHCCRWQVRQCRFSTQGERAALWDPGSLAL